MIFCSYSTINKNKIEPIIDFLKENNIEIWFDESKIKAGDSLFKQIEEGLNSSDFFLAFFTSEYLESSWCQQEYEAAHILEIENKEKFIIPIILDDCKPSILTRSKRIIYLNNNQEKGLQELIDIVNSANNYLSIKEIPLEKRYSIISDHYNYKNINIHSLNDVDIDKLIKQIVENKHLSISLQFECKADDSHVVVLNKIKTILNKLEKKVRINKIKKIDFCILGISPKEALFYFKLHKVLKVFKPKYNCELTYRTEVITTFPEKKDFNSLIAIVSKKDKQDTIEEIKNYLYTFPNSILTLEIQLENSNDITLVTTLKSILIKIDKELTKEQVFFIKSNEIGIVLSQLKERVKFKHIIIKHKEK